MPDHVSEQVRLTLDEIQTLDDPEFASRLSLYERFRLRAAVEAILRGRYAKWEQMSPIRGAEVER